MVTFIEALLPVFSLIIIGYLFRYYAFPSAEFWPLAARITYFAFFPALVLTRLALADLHGIAIVPLALALSIPVLVMTVLVVLVRPLLRVSNPAFTSIFQGSVRFNTYVGLATAAVLLGNDGVALASIALAVLIPLVNVLCVTVLTIYGGHGPLNWWRVLRSIMTNPLIIACAIGILLNWTTIGLPLGSASILEIFSRAALPMGLLTVGAGLDLAAVRTAVGPVLLSSLLKLVVMPLLAALACHLLQVEGTVAGVVILFGTLPTAPSAYILAQELGGDVKLMAGILTVQTLLAVITMPLAALLW